MLVSGSEFLLRLDHWLAFVSFMAVEVILYLKKCIVADHDNTTRAIRKV